MEKEVIKLSPIHFQTTYPLSHQYDAIKSRVSEILGRFLADSSIYNFNDHDKSLTFTSERLILEKGSGRQRILLLFSNPHPHSLQWGMFLSPSITGRQNLFWKGMLDAGWFKLPEINPSAERMAEIFLNLDYESPFEVLFYCYYSFSTRYPEDLVKLFGKEYFNKVIEPEAREGFERIIQEETPEVVVTFNKGVYNLVSAEPIGKYIDRLKAGEVIRRKIKDVDNDGPIFLTYPTGWRYDLNHQEYRRKNLEKVKDLVLRGAEK